MTKTALVTGPTGQTGSYMCEKLLTEGLEVYGFHRRNSQNVFKNLQACLEHTNFHLIEGDLTDFSSVSGTINELKPDYLFNYAAQSHVYSSFEQPINTFNVNTLGVLNILESIKKFSPKTKMLQANSSEQFGNNYEQQPCGSGYFRKIQTEKTEFKPRSPYAISKVAAHQLCKNYRESYGLYIVCSICFNHESERRGETFVTRKITKWIANNYSNLMNPKNQRKDFPKLKLGNLDSYRDWGHAKDYCDAQRLMMDLDIPQDLIICTGKTYSIKNFLDKAFKYIGISDWSNFVEIDPKFYRPSEVDYLCGDNSRIKELTGWRPKYTLDELIEEMIKNDLEEATRS